MLMFLFYLLNKVGDKDQWYGFHEGDDIHSFNYSLIPTAYKKKHNNYMIFVVNQLELSL